MKISPTLALHVLAVSASPLYVRPESKDVVYYEVPSNNVPSSKTSMNRPSKPYPKTPFSKDGHLCLEYVERKLSEVPHECIFDYVCVSSDNVVHGLMPCFSSDHDPNTIFSVEELENMEPYCRQEALCPVNLTGNYYSDDDDDDDGDEEEEDEEVEENEDAKDNKTEFQSEERYQCIFEDSSKCMNDERYTHRVAKKAIVADTDDRTGKNLDGFSSSDVTSVDGNGLENTPGHAGGNHADDGHALSTRDVKKSTSKKSTSKKSTSKGSREPISDNLSTYLGNEFSGTEFIPEMPLMK